MKRRNLEADMKTLRLVLDLTQKLEFAAAAALAEKTLADGFEHPMLLNVAATHLEHSGQHQEACRLLERAVAIAPDDVGARNALGLCLLTLNRPREALFHINEIIQKHPELPFAHASRGSALVAMGMPLLAQQSHLQAVQLDPGNFVSIAGLAAIAIQRGQHKQATQWAERALALAPGFPDAVLSLAAAELSSGNLDSAEFRLQRLILDSRSGQIERARAAGLIGDVRDAAGRYAEAFEYYELSTTAFAQIFKQFAETDLILHTRALTDAIERIDASRWRAHAHVSTSDAAGHIFLIGFPPTGTRLLDAALGGSPQVISLEDNELLTKAAMLFMGEPVNFQALECVDEAMVATLQADYWRGVRATGLETSGKFFIDKHPLNGLRLPMIIKLFPNAKLLFAVRDPRDVVLSCFRHRFPMNPSMYKVLSLAGTAICYAAMMQFTESVKRVLAAEWHEIRCERLVTDLDSELRAICHFIGLSLDFNPISRECLKSSQSGWRNYEAQLLPVLPILAPWLEQLGYPG